MKIGKQDVTGGKTLEQMLTKMYGAKGTKKRTEADKRIAKKQDELAANLQAQVRAKKKRK